MTTLIILLGIPTALLTIAVLRLATVANGGIRKPENTK